MVIARSNEFKGFESFFFFQIREKIREQSRERFKLSKDLSLTS